MTSLHYRHGSYHQFSHEIREQMSALKQNETSELASAETELNQSANTLYCVLLSNHNVIAFVETVFKDKRAEIQSIIVIGKQRRSGIGTALLRYCFETLNDMGMTQAAVTVPSNKQRFFTRFGFVLVSESNLEHRSQMLQPTISYYLNNAPSLGLSRTEAANEDAGQVMQLGKDSRQYPFTNEEQFTDLHKLMLSQARKRIWILAPNIECPVINSEDTSQAIYRLIKRNSDAEVRILLTNDKLGAGYFNPCVNLAQRLSSYVEIRLAQSSGSRIKESITLIDYGATIFRKHMNTYSGFACFHNRLIYERMRSNFDNHWQFGSQSMHLRRLVI